MKKISVISVFTDFFIPFLSQGMISKAIKLKLLEVELISLRDFSGEYPVDDSPYGTDNGGMVLTYPTCYKALCYAKDRNPNSKVIFMSPAGDKLTQKLLVEYSANNHNYILVCGRYAGIDERFIEYCVDQELSIGDYVLSGGDIAAMAFIEGVNRLIPGVLNNPNVLNNECFSDNLLNYPEYTRPYIYRNHKVPDILLSGNHNLIKEWRLTQRIAKTKKLNNQLPSTNE